MAIDKHKEICERVLTDNLEKVTRFLMKVINGTAKNEIFVKADFRTKEKTGEIGCKTAVPISIGDQLYAVELFNRLVMTKVVPNERKKPSEEDSGKKLDVKDELTKLSDKLGIKGEKKDGNS